MNRSQAAHHQLVTFFVFASRVRKMAVASTSTLKQDDVIWGALILGGVIAAIAWRTLFTENQTEDDVLNVIPNKKLRKKFQEEDEDSSMVIAVDATPNRVGGILKLPKHRRLYYYSFYWTDHFSFPQKQQSQKFELANALVALVVFQSDIQFFRHRYKKLLMKTDNSIFLQQDKLFRQRKDVGNVEMNDTMFDAQRLFDKVQDRLNFFQGEWREAQKDDDIDLFQAVQLSKTGSLQYIPKGYNTYEITDWSVQARLATESDIKQRINTKYTHVVDDYY